MPSFLDPVKLLGQFGTLALLGLLVVIFVESGVLFPVLPGDSLLFVAGMLAAGSAAAAAAEGAPQANFQLWQLLVFIPIAAILGGQVGYWIGRGIGTSMFKPDARFLKQRYLDEAHAFFEKRGPFAIVIARFVPIVRTLAPITAGAARMSYPIFALYNIVGAVVWGVGITLLGYWLGQFPIIQKLLEPIFILIVLASVAPMFLEWMRRRKAGKTAEDPRHRPGPELSSRSTKCRDLPHFPCKSRSRRAARSTSRSTTRSAESSRIRPPCNGTHPETARSCRRPRAHRPSHR